MRNGWPLPETWRGFSQYAYETLPLRTKYLSGPEVLAFRDKAFRVYFSNHNYLGAIAKKFGLITARHIEEMASHRLKRKHVADV